MGKSSRKIINDPVHGFITIDEPIIHEIIADPAYQRLRRISQMAMAHLVYPGAIHTRLHHSLGAYHLMGMALQELRNKGVSITPEESQAARIAVLLHDIGHGPFSHALEKALVPLGHESLSLLIMEALNRKLDNRLELAIRIFTGRHPKKFLHQLVSGQLDVDRLDYLTRDSFFTGVSEGVIGYDRIIKMLVVHEGELMVEEKGIYSIEKFLVARRLMYWQVYLHKTVVAAETMLAGIVRRAKELFRNGIDLQAPEGPFSWFLQHTGETHPKEELLQQFCLLDDVDVMAMVKAWTRHPDIVLSELCSMLLDRRLLKVKFLPAPPDEASLRAQRNAICHNLNITEQESRYFLFTGEAENTTYNPEEERIRILFRDGSVRDISAVDNALIHQTLATPMKKFYICSLKV